MGLEPTRYCYHKILSLARLPVPTLPHLSDDRIIVTNVIRNVKEMFVKNFLKKFQIYG